MELTLKDIINLKYGYGLSKKKRRKGVYPVYGSGGIIDFHNEYMVKGPGIIIGRKGTIGRVYFEKNNYVPIDTVFFAESLHKNNCFKYIYYLLITCKLHLYNSDAAVPGLNKNIALKKKIRIHNNKDQKKIASILGKYDDLIENNNRQIELLEKMFQSIFNEWFISFRYPGHEKEKKIKSKFGLIPKNWKIDYIKKHVIFERGVEPGSKNYFENKKNNSVPFIRVANLSEKNIDIYIPKNFSKNKFLNENDVAVSMDGTVGIVKIGLSGCYSTGIRKLVVKNNSYLNKEFVYGLMKSYYVQELMKAHAVGTTILHASTCIDYIDFVLPKKKIVQLFYNNFTSVFKKIKILKKENKYLLKSRDLLLNQFFSKNFDFSIVSKGS